MPYPITIGGGGASSVVFPVVLTSSEVSGTGYDVVNGRLVSAPDLRFTETEADVSGNGLSSWTGTSNTNRATAARTGDGSDPSDTLHLEADNQTSSPTGGTSWHLYRSYGSAPGRIGWVFHVSSALGVAGDLVGAVGYGSSSGYVLACVQNNGGVERFLFKTGSSGDRVKNLVGSASTGVWLRLEHHGDDIILWINEGARSSVPGRSDWTYIGLVDWPYGQSSTFDWGPTFNAGNTSATLEVDFGHFEELADLGDAGVGFGGAGGWYDNIEVLLCAADLGSLTIDLTALRSGLAAAEDNAPGYDATSWKYALGRGSSRAAAITAAQGATPALAASLAEAGAGSWVALTAYCETGRENPGSLDIFSISIVGTSA